MSPEFRYAVRSEIRNTDDAAGYEIAKLINSSNSATGVETFSNFYRVAISYWCAHDLDMLIDVFFLN